MNYSNSFMWKDLLEFEIEILENEKNHLLSQLELVNVQLHHKYQQLIDIEDIVSVRVSLKDLIEAIKNITHNENISIKIYALSSLFQNSNEEDLEKSSSAMNYIGSEMIIFLNDKSVIYSHLSLFEHFSDLQSDGKTLLEHCTVYSRRSFQDLVVDKDMDEVIANFYLDQISPGKMARTNDNDCLLEQAIFQCILSDKIIDYQKKENHLKK